MRGQPACPRLLPRLSAAGSPRVRMGRVRAKGPPRGCCAQAAAVSCKPTRTRCLLPQHRKEGFEKEKPHGFSLKSQEKREKIVADVPRRGKNTPFPFQFLEVTW